MSLADKKLATYIQSVVAEVSKFLLVVEVVLKVGTG